MQWAEVAQIIKYKGAQGLFGAYLDILESPGPAKMGPVKKIY